MARMGKITPKRRPKNRVIISRDVMFTGKKNSCDNKYANKDLVDEGNESDESDDTYADIHSLIRHSDSGISDSSVDLDYQTKSDEDDCNDDEESIFSSSNSEDHYGYSNDGYESEDSCTDMPDLIHPNQQVINAMKKLGTSYSPIARNIVPES